MKYKAFTLKTFKTIPQIKKLSPEQIFDIEVVGSVLPFKADSYVVDELIDWDDFENDPISILTFPKKEMLSEENYSIIASLLKNNAPKEDLKKAVAEIRHSFNPNPAGQESNIPVFNDEKLVGAQHKYDETMLFFPSQGQTCHAYCTFCFRWPQFAAGLDSVKFAMKEIEKIIGYLKENPQITDLLFTGGDPMIMKTKQFKAYVDAILEANIPSLQTIRIGTKTLGYWPYRYITDPDAAELLDVFKSITDSGLNLSIMAHFNHINELKTDAVAKAIKLIRSTGAAIRTQSPIMAKLNDNADMWANMWKKQVSMGLIPYYMFIARDTGPQKYFAISLDRAWEIFRDAYSQVSGIARTVRGPSMSSKPGKIQINGVAEINGQKVFVLNLIQARDASLVGRPFFAKYKPDAYWLNDLESAFDDKFLFE